MDDIKQILARLKTGNERFIQDKLERPHQDNEWQVKLTKGQQPFAIILSCADSRVVPELIFDTGMGELFVLRVAGNIANTSTIASIEYAISHLHTHVVIVLGHESCGAVTAALSDGDHGYNLNHLLAHIQPAKFASRDKSVDQVARTNAILTKNELVRRSPILEKAVNDNSLEIVPAFYHLDSGKVDFYIDRD
jgi:carbonic anhydrase